MPKVSVVINCHNGAPFLKKAIKSVFSQTFSDWEIIFFNNASTDNSEEIARSFGNKVKISNSKKLLNLGHARAEAVNLCSGEWITFLDSDDLWVRDKLQSQINEIDGTHFALGYGGVIQINDQGSTLGELIPKYESGHIFKEQLRNFEINMVTPIVNANFLSKNNLNFDHNFTVSEAFDLFIKICALSPINVQKRVLGFYRVYEDSTTNKLMKNWALERFSTLEFLKKNHTKLINFNREVFESAQARGEYYLARYHYEKGNRKEAKRLLRKNIHSSKIYFFLYLLAYFPIFWNFLHIRKVKGFLNKFL